MEELVRHVRRFQKGDADAFEALFRAEGPRLGLFVRRYFYSRDTAEDVFQDTWLRAWNKRDSLREPERFTSWLYQIARNAVFEELRRRKRRPEINLYGGETDPRDPEELLNLAPDPGPDPRARAVVGQLKTAIETEMSVLDEQAREMLALRFGADLGLREIADILGVPLGTVCAKVSRSLKTVRDSLEKKGISWRSEP